MLQLKCTKKLIDFLDLSTEPPTDIEPNTVLGDWHANYIKFGNVDFIIFLNDLTLFCMIKVIQFPTKNLSAIFINILTNILQDLNIDFQIIKKISTQYSEIKITKTSSRSILGNMNEITNRFLILCEDNLETNDKINLYEIVKRLNNVPQKNLGWNFPEEYLKEILMAP